jgi:hypothetical protein
MSMSCATILLPLPEFDFLRAVRGVGAVGAARTEDVTCGVAGVPAGFGIVKKEASVDCVRSLDAISRGVANCRAQIFGEWLYGAKKYTCQKKKSKKRFF